MYAVILIIGFLSSVTDRILGASTAYPYIADKLTGTIHNSYFTKIEGPGNWEVFLLIGAFISGIVISLLRKEFRLTIIHSNW